MLKLIKLVCITVAILINIGHASFETEVLTKYAKSWLKEDRGFEPNCGQIVNTAGENLNDVIFSSKCNNLGVYITKHGVSYIIYKPEILMPNQDNKFAPFADFIVNYARIDLILIGAKIDESNIVYEDELPGYANYYLPNSPSGILNVKKYRRVRIRDVYPGIDWVWRYENGILHHEFEIMPCAEIGRIKYQVKYADMEILEGGKKAVYSTPLGKIEDGEINAYEILDSGKRLRVPEVRYKKGNNNLISYFVNGYSGVNRLIIDPPLSLLWATYYGGEDIDYSMNIIVDNNGNVFLSGTSMSNTFPTYDPGGGVYYQGVQAGNGDAFIVKFNNAGMRLWATYYGGSTGWEIFSSLAIDSYGNVFACGWTGSTDFPTYNPGGGAYYQDSLAGQYYNACIVKFNNAGVRLWATYYGGDIEEWARGIAVDNMNNVWIVGHSWSTNFPTYDPGGGAYYQATNAGNADIFILKFNNSGSLLWATYYGGSMTESAFGIDVDAGGNVFICGYTESGNLPTYDPGGGAYYQGTHAGGTYDGFILKFNNSGIRLWATYYGGGAGWDIFRSITVDNAGNIFITGDTRGFPTYNPGGGAYYQGTNAGYQDAFILKFSNSGVRLWATHYGGERVDTGYSINLDGFGNLFITGKTWSTYFPKYNPGGGAYYQDTIAGEDDAFILKFTNTGVRQWATYYGGSAGDQGYSIDTDSDGNIFVSGATYSVDIPTTDPGGAYYQDANGGSQDAFILKFERSLIGIQEKKFDKLSNLPKTLFFMGNNIELMIHKSSNTPVNISLYTPDGRRLFTDNYYNEQTIVIQREDIKNLPAGVYFLFVNLNNSESETIKFIKLK